jgi:hypothetical protein
MITMNRWFQELCKPRLNGRTTLLAIITAMIVGSVIAADSSEKPAIPDFLEKLNLSSKQQDQVKEIVREYDASIAKVWKKFGEHYMKTIATETSLLAAIEDNLTEVQRTKIHSHRHKTSQHDTLKANGETPNPPKSNNVDPVAKELEDLSVVLTPEQEAMSDKIQESYRAHMRTLNREIQGLHLQLLSLEADKLVAIEKVLTQEQLASLRQHRQKGPAHSKATKSPADAK